MGLCMTGYTIHPAPGRPAIHSKNAAYVLESGGGASLVPALRPHPRDNIPVRTAAYRFSPLATPGGFGALWRPALSPVSPQSWQPTG